MGVITISLEDESEKKLRELAVSKFGKNKGSISMVLKEAINSLSEKEKGTAEERLMGYAEQGFHLGKINSKKLRGEIYNGRIGGV